MKIISAKIKNFRLLFDVELNLEDETTVIVGRNNSGKTSLAELIKRFLGSDSPSFQLEDFSSECYATFSQLFIEKLDNNDIDESSVADSLETLRSRLPAIELHLTVQYDKNMPDFGALSPFIIDLDENCTQTIIIIKYALENGKLDDFFSNEISPKENPLFLQELRKQISKSFTIKVWAQDPNDEENQRELTLKDVKKVIKVDFINAQRGLDDITTKESKPLAKLLEGFFDATSTSEENGDQSTTQRLESAVSNIQNSINENFSEQLKDLLPSLEQFGYPGLGTQVFKTEIILDVKKLLSNFTNIYYPNNGAHLPESYNGLGTRNLILILLQLAKFYKEFSTSNSGTDIHLIFIEEPEAHLHPQMQEVFIKQLSEVVKTLTDKRNSWNPQFIISTHSSHISNSARFENIRYFLQNDKNKTTQIKDLRKSFSDNNKEFIHKYMTLTKSDLFFADKAILFEGLTERLMLPKMIEKLDNEEKTNLRSNYLTLLEISGAYAHIFIPLLEFLELKTLIITDLDSVDNTLHGKACVCHKGISTSNACIRSWFNNEKNLSIIQQKTDSDKIKGKIRIAYQCSEDGNNACGRSFEDAFMLANKALFTLQGNTDEELELNSYKKANREKKSDFAIEYAINNTEWDTPKYIKDGLIWLAAKGK